jgi:hypothetical protein
VLLLPLGLALVFGLLVWGVAHLAIKPRENAQVVAAFLIAMLFLYGHLYDLTLSLQSDYTWWPIAFGCAWFVLVLASVTFLIWRPGFTRRLVEPSAITVLVFTAMLLLNIGRGESVRFSHLALLRQSNGVQQAKEDGAVAQLPNIYYFILDGYGRADILKQVYDCDTTGFLDYLKRKGFYVAPQSHSNYSQTIVSLPSSLNFCYLDKIARQMGKASGDQVPLSNMISDAQVTRLLRAYGYRTIAFPSEYHAVRMASDVPVLSLDGLPDFTATVMKTTPLLLLTQLARDSYFDPYAYHRRYLLKQFAEIPRAADIPGPVFVFAHILAPHQPIVFDADGNPLSAQYRSRISANALWRIQTSDRQVYRWKYGQEVTYLNKRMEGIIDQILANSKGPTIIILQGDHGPGFVPDAKDVSQISVPERFSILNAYLVPPAVAHALYPSITPVNTFRVVFDHCFNTHFGLLEDRSYFCGGKYPYDFTEVTDQLITTQPRADAQTRKEKAGAPAPP